MANTSVPKREVNEYRTGRNFIRLGDTVKIKSRPGKTDGFVAKVTRIVVDEDGEVSEVTVYGGKGGRAGTRTVTPDRVARMSQATLARKGQIK